MDLPLSLRAPTPLAYFASLVQDVQHLPLLEACASLALDDHPLLDVQEVLNHVDMLRSRVFRHLPSDVKPLGKLQILNRFFYSEMGFGLNLNDIDHPNNSFIHHVLRTRVGTPVSLGVLWLELAQALGLSAWGVNFPNHFLIKIRLPEGLAVMDPADGRSLTLDHLQQLLQMQHLPYTLTENSEVPLPMYLQRAQPEEVLSLMLYNLLETAEKERHQEQQIKWLQRLCMLMPHNDELSQSLQRLRIGLSSSP